MEATAMDFHTLSRRDLQALCKRNGIRANMTNTAMADALHALPSVDGLDDIGSLLGLPTPAKSAVKPMVGEEQHGSPLPRGRRVSVKSPEAIRMDVEEKNEGLKRGMVKEIVRTPGVALRSSSRRARAMPMVAPTPAPSSVRTTRRRAAASKEEDEGEGVVEALPTPVTLRRSQRTTGRKVVAETEQQEESSRMTSTGTRRTAAAKMMMALDQEDKVAAAMTVVQEEEPKGDASDEKYNDPKEEEEATKLQEEERSSKASEPEQEEEGVTSGVLVGSALVSDDRVDITEGKEMVVMEEQATKPQEVVIDAPVEGTAEEQPVTEEPKNESVQEHVSEHTASLPSMVDSPILGLVSESEPVVMEKRDASVGDVGGFVELSLDKVRASIDHVSEEKVVVTTEEAINEEINYVHEEEEEVLTHGEVPQAIKEFDFTGDVKHDNEEKEGVVDEMLQATVTTDEAIREHDDFACETSHVNEEEKGAVDKMSLYSVTADRESVEEGDITSEINHVIEEATGAVEMPQAAVTVDEAVEEDDFTGDLPSEFDKAGDFSDAETEEDITLPVLEEAQGTVASPAKISPLVVNMLNDVVKSLAETVITVELQAHGEEAPVRAKVAEEMKPEASLCSYKKEDENGGEAKEAKEKEKKPRNLNEMSLRKLRAEYKKGLIAAKVAKGKRLALAELDENVC